MKSVVPKCISCHFENETIPSIKLNNDILKIVLVPPLL